MNIEVRDVYEKVEKLMKIEIRDLLVTFMKSGNIHENWNLGPPRDVYEKVEKSMKIEVRDLLVTFMKKLKNWWKLKFGTSSWRLWKSRKIDENWSLGPPRDVYEKVKQIMKIEVRDLLVMFMKKSKN